MVPLVKNHYDIYNRHTSPDHEGALYLSATSLDSVKSTKAAAVTKKVAKGKNLPAVLNPAAIPASVAKGNNRKILIKVSTRPPPKNKSSTGRSQSASISLPIARNEAGKPILAIKQKPLKQGAGGRSQAAAAAGNIKGELPVVTRPMPHIKRTLRNPYTNRVYSYSVSIPNYVAEEDEAALREYENENSETDSSNGTPGNSLESVLLYSSSAPTSTTNLKERLAHHGDRTNGSGSDGASSSSEEEEFASNLSSPICPDSPTHESVAAGVMNCSATSLVYAYEAITAELNIPSTPLPSLATVNTKAKVKRMVSAPGEIGISANTKTSQQQQQQPPCADKDGNQSNTNESSRPSNGNAREYIELLRKFIVHLKLLKLGSSKKLFSSSSKTGNNNNSSNNSNNNNNHQHHERSSSERRPRKDTMEDSKHL